MPVGLLRFPLAGAVLLLAALSTWTASAADVADDPLPKGAKVRFGVSRPILRTGPEIALVPPLYSDFLAPTVNGSVRVSGASAPVVAGTANGDVTAETTDGPVNAFSVNGSVHVAIGGFADTGAVKVVTVNGAVTVELPARLDATVNARTVHGSIDSDFPLALSSTFGVRHAAGAIGAGGRPIDVNAVNGSIRLKKVRRVRAQ